MVASDKSKVKILAPSLSAWKGGLTHSLGVSRVAMAAIVTNSCFVGGPGRPR